MSDNHLLCTDTGEILERVLGPVDVALRVAQQHANDRRAPILIATEGADSQWVHPSSLH